MASRVLNEEFKIAEEAFRDGQLPQVPDEIVTACDDLFASNTQAYREALLGCAVVRIVDPDVDVRYPHLDLSPKAFSGRGLDERVINPFLKYHEIPSSNGHTYPRSAVLCVWSSQCRKVSGIQKPLRH